MGRAVGSGPATLLLPSTSHRGWCCHFPALPCLPFAPASRGHRLVPGSPGGEDGVRRQLGPCCTHEVWVVGGDGGAALIQKHSDATLHGKVWWPRGFPSPSSTKPCSSPPPLDPTPSLGIWGSGERSCAPASPRRCARPGSSRSTYIHADRSLRPLRARLPRQTLPGETGAFTTLLACWQCWGAGLGRPHGGEQIVHLGMHPGGAHPAFCPTSRLSACSEQRVCPSECPCWGLGSEFYAQPRWEQLRSPSTVFPPLVSTPRAQQPPKPSPYQPRVAQGCSSPLGAPTSPPDTHTPMGTHLWAQGTRLSIRSRFSLGALYI